MEFGFYCPDTLTDIGDLYATTTVEQRVFFCSSSERKTEVGMQRAVTFTGGCVGKKISEVFVFAGDLNS